MNSMQNVPENRDLVQKFTGLLLGTAVGDALGLPAEGMTPEKIQGRWGNQWEMRFVFGRGMISDDTEHTLMVAQALLEHPDDVIAFQRSLAWKLRWWFVGLPAGVGLATARACFKLWLGFPPPKSGVFSAGNGPAMRSAIIGAYFAAEPQRLKEFVQASTVITHSDPKALIGALAVAQLAAWSVRNPTATSPDLAAILDTLRALGDDPEWMGILARISVAYEGRMSVEDFARQFGSRGVSGYIYHTVPVAIYAWLRHFNDFENGLVSALNCGGDTDTVGAITGALLGAVSGSEAIPGRWLSRLCDYPRSPELLQKVSQRLATQRFQNVCQGNVSYLWPLLIPRNLFFLTIVLVHGFRRMI